MNRIKISRLSFYVGHRRGMTPGASCQQNIHQQASTVRALSLHAVEPERKEYNRKKEREIRTNFVTKTSDWVINSLVGVFSRLWCIVKQ